MESGESVGSLFKKISNNDTCDNIMETRQAEFQDEGYFVDFFKEIEQYVRVLEKLVSSPPVKTAIRASRPFLKPFPHLAL